PTSSCGGPAGPRARRTKRTPIAPHPNGRDEPPPPPPSPRDDRGSRRRPPFDAPLGVPDTAPRPRRGSPARGGGGRGRAALTMGHGYVAVGWSRQKRVYDAVLTGGVLLYLALFVVLHVTIHPNATIETALIRALGTCAFLMLHVILSIGPLARL